MYHMTSSGTGPWTTYQVISSLSAVELQSMNEYYTFLDSVIIPSSSTENVCMRTSACK